MEFLRESSAYIGLTQIGVYQNYMVTLLNSFLAWALIAAAIPLLIHLFTQKKLKVIPFSTLHFLHAMQKEKVRKVKLRQLLLLILRTLILFFLILAFLRPTLKTSDFSIGQQAKSTAVVIVDNSLSMGLTERGQSKLSLVKSRADEIIDLLNEGDTVCLISAGFPAKLVHTGVLTNSKIMQKKLNDIGQEATATDMEGALSLALAELENSESLNREVYLLSDNNYRLGQDMTQFLQQTTDVRFFGFEWPEERSRNFAVTDISLKNQLFEVGRAVEVEVTVKNYGPIDEKKRMVYLLLNGTRVAQEHISVPSGEARKIVMRVSPSETGYQQIVAEIEGDQLDYDNRRYHVFHIPERLSALAVGNSLDDLVYLKLALQSGPQDSLLSVRETTFSALSRESFSNWDLLILSNIPRFDSQLSRKIDNYVKQGGGILLFLGDDVDLKNYNESLFKKYALGTPGATLGSITGEKSILGLGESSYEHSIFQGMFEKKEDAPHVESPGFRFAVNVHENTAANTILRYSNKSPLLVERTIGKSTLLAFFTSARENWSDFPFKGLFAPLVLRSAKYAGGRSKMPGDVILAGESARAALPDDEAGNFYVQTPARSAHKIRPIEKDGRFLLRFAETGQTGFYLLLADEKEKHVWAANFDPEELEAGSSYQHKFKAAVGDRLTMLPVGASISDELLAWRYGREFWQWCLVLCLIGLIAEMMLFRTPPGLKQGAHRNGVPA